MMKRGQLNATLRINSDDWEHVKHAEMKDTAKESESPEPSSEDEYFHVETREELLAVLDEKGSDEASASTQQVNQAIRTQMERRPLTPYLRKEDNSTGEESVPGYEEMIKRLEEWKTSSEERVATNLMKNHLESDASKKRIIPTLKRENAGTKHDKLSWTACYNNDC
jgi:hypothetical protein